KSFSRGDTNDDFVVDANPLDITADGYVVFWYTAEEPDGQGIGPLDPSGAPISQFVTATTIALPGEFVRDDALFLVAFPDVAAEGPVFLDPAGAADATPSAAAGPSIN